ncbi:MAG: ribosomal RNA small subunit methyltransferase A [Candidatus Rokubacteria bacterium GWA2_70_23]|nr:MAG: ribosomal RNA small subunit methyltransferase A [Candidatus Rokubacteria bacterium GWA2_70_23]
MRPARAGRPTRGRRRALGQHFLRDEGIARRIVELLRPGLSDLVVEIGPGEGALTGHLAASAGRLVALEVDPGLAARLRERFAGTPHVEILEADAIRHDYAALPGLRPDPAGRVLVVGNLPYSVGTAILASLLTAGPAIARVAPMEMALMLQREVAERVAAAPGSRTYGSLSVLSQMAAEVRVAFSVSPGAFRPPPQVDSAVIHLRALPAPPVAVADPGGFRTVVLAAFSQRRKTLANALASGLRLPVGRLKDVLAATGIDPARRAETLSLAEFARLAEALPGA